MLIDMHAHSAAISPCCQIPFEKVIDLAKDSGIDGIVLTNHYQKSYIKKTNIDMFVEQYINEFFAAQQYGKKVGSKVFFGIEVTMELYPNVHMLIYGIEPEFLKENPYIFDNTQKELYDIVKSNNGILIQAHPFRNGTTVLDTDFLDGIEINCHPLYKISHSKELLEIADERNLIVTCGGDYHADTYRPKCGMLLPDNIQDNNGLRSYMLSLEEKKLCIQEPNSSTYTIICTK